MLLILMVLGLFKFILYPYFDKDGNFLGGIGVEFNFENLRGKLKKDRTPIPPKKLPSLSKYGFKINE